MEVASCIETFYVLAKKTAWDGEETELTSESEPEIKVSSWRRGIRHIKGSLVRRAQQGTSEEPWKLSRIEGVLISARPRELEVRI